MDASKAKIMSNTGNAQIVKVGQTASDKHGANPDMQERGGNGNVRDLNFK